MKLFKFRLAALAVAVCAVVPLWGQWAVGVQAGYTHNSLSTSSGYFYDRVYHAQGGFTIGVPVRYSFADWFAVGAEATFVQKGYDARRSGFYRVLHEDVSNNYLSLPVYARFSFGGKRLRGFMTAGGYLGGWLSGHRKGATYRSYENVNPGVIMGFEDVTGIYYFDEKWEFDSRRDNRFEAGLLAGAGVSYLVHPKFELFGEVRYYHSLTDMQKNYMRDRVPRYNNTFAFQVGVMYLWGK